MNIEKFKQLVSLLEQASIPDNEKQALVYKQLEIVSSDSEFYLLLVQVIEYQTEI